MNKLSILALLLLLVLSIAGCSESPFAESIPADLDVEVSDAESSESTIDGVADGTAKSSTEDTSDAADQEFFVSVEEKSAAAAESVRRRVGELFQRVLPTLENTRELVDRHAGLPERTRVPFKPDKKSNASEINRLLDKAIEMLGISEVSDYREQILAANEAIRDSHAEIADLRRQKVSAPFAKEQGRLDKVNPFVLSKETLDQRVAEEEAKIERNDQRLIELKQSFAAELTKIGLDVDQDGVESLLSSVSGDDIVTMAVVFDNIKHLTTQLQELTEKSGEALDVSKRYYGMYVVMIQVMDRIQKNFIRDVTEEHIPKLIGFAEQAEGNIARANALIKADGGDAATLQANIASNQLTQQTANLYVDYLRTNAELIKQENQLVQRNLATAMNTYDTVKLSSDVAALMNTGRQNFDTLMKLQVPTLREFGNEAIRKEFQRMTSELRSAQ